MKDKTYNKQFDQTAANASRAAAGQLRRYVIRWQERRHEYPFQATPERLQGRTRAENIEEPSRQLFHFAIQAATENLQRKLVIQS